MTFFALTSLLRLPESSTQLTTKSSRPRSVRADGWASSALSRSRRIISPSERLFQLPLLVDRKLAVLLYLTNDYLRRSMSQTLDHSEIDWTAFVKNAPVHLWARKDGVPMTNKQMIFISHVFNKASTAGNLLSFLDRISTSVNCCRLFAQDRSIETMHEIAFAYLSRDSQQRRLLGHIESLQDSHFATGAVRFVASEDCYVTFICIWRNLFEQGVNLSIKYFIFY